MPRKDNILNLPGFSIKKVSGYNPLIWDVYYRRKSPIAFIALETGLSMEGATKGLSDLIEIGFSSKNLLAKIREMGGLWIRGTGRHCFLDHPAAEEMECLVQQLAEQQPKRAEVLRICYLCPEVPEEKAKEGGCSTSQYYFQLKLAHEWFVGYVSARAMRKIN